MKLDSVKNGQTVFVYMNAYCIFKGKVKRANGKTFSLQDEVHGLVGPLNCDEVAVGLTLEDVKPIA
jgi:hypothetical protein